MHFAPIRISLGQAPVLSHAKNPRDKVEAKAPPLVHTHLKGWSGSEEGNPGALEADKTELQWPQETQGKIEKVCLDGVGKSHRIYIWKGGFQGKLRPSPHLVSLPPPQSILQVATPGHY